MKVLHLSDVHLAPVVPGRPPWHGGWRRLLAQVELKLMGRARRYVDAPQALARILEEAASLGVDHLVLSGDLTVLARDEEFALVAEALGPLTGQPARLTVVPGNHDRYTPGATGTGLRASLRLAAGLGPPRVPGRGGLPPGAPGG